MKKLLFMTLILSLFSVSCMNSERTTPSKKKSNDSNDNNSNDNGTNTSGGNGGNTETGTGNGVTCHGNSNDGYGDGYSIINQGILLGGSKNWVPGVYSGLGDSILTIKEARMLFSSDSKLKVRFKVHSQPTPSPVGAEYCYGRNTGISPDVYKYDNLWITVNLRDVICKDPNDSPFVGNGKCDYNNDGQETDADFELGNPYNSQYLGPIAVDGCSPIVDIGGSRNPTAWGTVIEIVNIESDSKCQKIPSSEHYCPKYAVHSGMCWQLTMQVVNDFSQDFK